MVKSLTKQQNMCFFIFKKFDLHSNLVNNQISIEFLVPPKIAPFSFGDEPMNYDETVSVTCTVSGGDLPINFIWLLNRVPLEPYLEVLTEKRGKRINVLMIESLKAKHAGNYTCLASNEAGSVEYTSELIVNG